VLVRISVDVGTPLSKSTVASISSQGVTGLGFVQLEDNGSSTELLVPNDDDPPRIALKAGLLDKLLGQSEIIFDQVEQASTKLNQLLAGENQQALVGAITRMGQAADSLNQLAVKLGPTAASLGPTVQSLKTAADDVSKAANGVGDTVQRLNAKGGALDKIGEGGAALGATVETFGAATLPRLGEVADETARAMRQLRRTVSAVDDNPQSLIFGNGPPTPGPGEPGFTAPGGKP
jgi:phospholipid/cholesterol/gamma-HCH transport system substrate-binding protein